jgi:thiamine phosphate synthase YjbQ (UPF0047 family)
MTTPSCGLGAGALPAGMRAHTDYLWFETRKRHELVNITDRVAAVVDAAGVAEGFCLVSAMHITAGIWVNDEERGLKQDVMEWLERLAPAGDYRHHETGEDNADAHRSLGAGFLCRVRRAAAKARGREGARGVSPPPAGRHMTSPGRPGAVESVSGPVFP